MPTKKPTKRDELPIVTVAAICEKMMEEGDRVISVIRIVDTVTMPEPPFDQKSLKQGDRPGIGLPLTVAISLKAGRSKVKQKMELMLVDPKKNREKLGKMFAHFKKPTLDTNQEVVGVNIKFPLRFPWRGFGVYWFEIEAMGKVVARMPLVLKKSEPEPSTSKKAP